MTPDAGLTSEDIKVLEYYAREGNRELYFNFLARKDGNDGYGLLALGVVRNDNAPGATANSFAARQAAQDGVVMQEGSWQKFGVELMRRDFALRQEALEEGRPDLALNLPAKQIRISHKLSFDEIGIHPSAWTPYKLLEAARQHGGEPEADAVWSMLLDNNRRGLDRLSETSALILGKYREFIDDPEGYVRDMALARAPHGLNPVSNSNPDNILYNGTSYQRTDEGGWKMQPSLPVTAQVGTLPLPVPGVRIPLEPKDVTDPAVLRYLDDAHDVRQQRESLRHQFHPDDPNRNRPITPSPWLISDAAPAPEPDGKPLVAGDFTEPGHARHALWQQCADGVRALDATVGKPWDTHSASMAASLTALAADNGLQRVDHLVLSVQRGAQAAGQNVFVVQGALDDPAHLRAHMATAVAINQAPEQSFQQVMAREREQAEQQAVQRTQDDQLQQGRSGPAMSA